MLMPRTRHPGPSRPSRKGRYCRWGAALAMLLALVTARAAPPRVVSLGGDITAVVYALHAEDVLAGVDSTSTWPKAATRLPSVGYVRMLHAEGILSLKPDRVIATHDAGPPTVLTQLREAGVRVDQLPVTRTPAGVVAKVRRIGQLLDRVPQADALASKLRAQFDTLAARTHAMAHHPSVLFLMSTGAGSPMAAGRGTAADSAISLSGGRNVVDGYAGYRPISAEALVALQPQVIVMMRGVGAGDLQTALALPGVARTPAGRQQRIVFVDGEALLGFGPRTAEQALQLQRQLAAIAATP